MRILLLMVLLGCVGDTFAMCAFRIYTAEGSVTNGRGSLLAGATVRLEWIEEIPGQDVQFLESTTGADGRFFFRFRYYPWQPGYICDGLLEVATLKVSAADFETATLDIFFKDSYSHVLVPMRHRR